MKNTHTPGPWILDGANAKIVSQDGTLISNVGFVSKNGTSVTYGDGQNLPNAKLIAAAPELLEALELMYDLVNAGNAPDNDDLDKALAAIKKATS